MRNASERLYDEFCGYITEKNQAEQRARQLLAKDPNADTNGIALFIAELDRKIMECHEQARKLDHYIKRCGPARRESIVMTLPRCPLGEPQNSVVAAAPGTW
jgi:hypothetical protein